MISLIWIYCDDPRNGGGRVVNLGALQGAVQPDGSRVWRFEGARRRRSGHADPRASRRETRASGLPIPAESMPAKTVFGDDGVRTLHVLQCPLCPRRPELRDETLQRVAEALNGQELLRVSLRLLETVAVRLGSNS